MGSEYHYLVGAEKVEHAGHEMSRAAAEINRAANSMSESVHCFDRVLEIHQDRLEAWLVRFEAAVERLVLDGPSV
jgi:hypothetical protein